jgi:hypothetical protein
MWEPRRLTTLWPFTACYKDSFTATIHKGTLAEVGKVVNCVTDISKLKC